MFAESRPASDDTPPVAEAVTAATLTAFEELVQTPLIPGLPYRTTSNPSADLITAEIALRRALPGRLLFTIEPGALRTLAGRYLPPGIEVTPEMMEDAAGEFANVIAGQTKTMLKGTPYHFTLSTPRIGHPKENAGEQTELLVIPFDFDAGRFAIYVRLPACPE